MKKLFNVHGKCKSLTALIIAMMMLSVFAGCGGQSSSQETTAATQSSEAGTTGETAANLPEAKIIYYTGGVFPLPDQEMVFEEFNKMLKEKINATVDFRVFDWGSYPQKMQTVISSGDDYDICYTSNWANDFTQNMAKGAFMPLDDLLAKYGKQVYASMPDTIWDGVRINGKIYAVINQQVYASSPAVFLPEKVLKESGYDWKTQYVQGDLRSLEPLVEYMGTHYEHSYFFPDFVATPLLGLEYLGGPIPAALDIKDGKTIVNPYKFPNFIKAIDDMQYYNSKGYTASDIRSAYPADLVPADQMGTNPNAYLNITGTYMPGYDAIMSQGKQRDDPLWVTGWPSIEPFVSANNLLATLIGFSANSKNPERAMMMVELMNLPPQEGEKYNELFNTFCFGIEGVHWQYTDDGRRHWLKPMTSYMPNLDWGAGCQFNAVPEDTMDADVYEQQREYNAKAKLSPAFGFAFNPEPVKTEVANCTGIITEYKRRMDLGTITDAEYDQLVTKLDQAGADTIIKEMQSQLDAYLASK